MSRLRYLNPFWIRDVARDVRRVMDNGGPTAVRLAGIEEPDGWILPTSTVNLEVVGRSRKVERFAPDVPVPFPYAWSWRIARRLGVPLVRSVKPEKLAFELPVPGR